MTTGQIRDAILFAGVKNLKEFGYPEVNKENILTDIVYSQFFKSMLNDNLGHDERTDAIINNLLAQIK